ncbi:MAG: cyclic nucleotide-binding domain-containing protein [Sulfuritalea sp.]|nr:cyclic nucleotide-binding domain-containing protein [Sulfuritalea sp.]
MKFKSIAADINAGAVGAIIAFPIILNCGFVLAQPLGGQFIAMTTSAALAASIVVALLRSLLAGEPLHLVSPKATFAVMLSTLLIGAVSQPTLARDFPSPEQQAGMLMALAFVCTLLAGAFQAVLGLSRLGKFVRFIPYPVIAGFINGFAVLLLLVQIPAMLGEQNWSATWRIVQGLSTPHFGAAVLGLAALLITSVLPRWLKWGPAALWGIVLGSALYWSAMALFPGTDLGRVVGTSALELPLTPQFDTLSGLLRSDAFAEIAPDLLATAIMIAMIASLQSLISISASGSVTGVRPDSNRELLLQGLGNVASGVMGGLPTGGSPSITRYVLNNGGRGRAANLAHGLMLAACAVGLGNVIGHIPVSVMAGVVVATTLTQLDGWSKNLLLLIGRQRQGIDSDLLATIAVVISVTLIVVVFGVVPALITGMSLSFVIFVRDASKNIVRRTLTGTHLHSRTTRPSAHQRVLSQLAERIVLVQVQGAIFFGSVEQLTDHLERATAGCQILVLDLKRADSIDGSGVVALNQLDKALTRTQCTLLLAYVGQGSPIRKSLENLGGASLIADGRCFDDTDSAVTHAEEILLLKAGISMDEGTEYPLEVFDILKGIQPDERAQLEALLHREEFEAGSHIVREGDASDFLYLLAAGRATVSRQIEGRVLRFSSFGPGVSFGEVGMLTGRPRGADVIAETRSVCWRLDGEDFRQICRRHPELGQRILINLSVGLSDIVTSLSEMVRELEE